MRSGGATGTGAGLPPIASAKGGVAVRTGAGGGTKAGMGTAAACAIIALSLWLDLAHRLSLGRRGARMSGAGCAAIRTSWAGATGAGRGATAARRATGATELFAILVSPLVNGAGGGTVTAAVLVGAGAAAGGAPNSARAETMCPELTAGNAAEAMQSPANPAEISAIA